MSEKTILKLYKNGNIASLDTPINEIENLFVNNTTQLGYLGDNGVFVAENTTQGTRTSDFIPVIGGQLYTLQVWFNENNIPGTGWAWAAFDSYDSNFNFIAREGELNEEIKAQSTTTFITSENAAYIRCCVTHLNHDAVRVQLVHGTTSKPYTLSLEDLTAQQLPHYSFNKNVIRVPKIIEFPPAGYQNHFIEKTSEPGYLKDTNGRITDPTECDRSSDYISVDGWGTATIQWRFVGMNGLYFPYVGVFSYNVLKEYHSIEISDYISVTSTGDYTHTVQLQIPTNAKFIKIVSNYYDAPEVSVKISVERGSTSNTKHYLAFEDMPSWVVDTGHPISFFKQGLVIKGEVTQGTQLIFADDFNRANNTTLGSYWVPINGNYGITNNAAKGTNQNGVNNIAFVNREFGDHISIAADINPFTSESIVFRAKDSTDYLQAQFELGDLVLKDRRNNVSSTLVKVILGAMNGTIYRLRVELRGAQIKIFVNDVLKITHETTTHINNTYCGIQSFANGATIGTFDNFEVKTL